MIADDIVTQLPAVADRELLTEQSDNFLKAQKWLKQLAHLAARAV